MLITFSCKAYADITMFGDIAIQMLKLMGHSGEVPSAIMADDVQQALHNLQAAVDEGRSLESSKQASNDEDDEPPVSLSQRALPLIELLKAADKAKCNVMWEGSGQ